MFDIRIKQHNYIFQYNSLIDLIPSYNILLSLNSSSEVKHVLVKQNLVKITFCH